MLIFAIYDLNGFNQAIEAVYPTKMYRTSSAVKLLGSYKRSEVKIRSSLGYVLWKYKKAVIKVLKTVYDSSAKENA